MTFSLVARCPRTGQVGVVISSSSPAVAARCPYVRANVGAVSTQNITDPRLGPRLLDFIEQGMPAPVALGRLIKEEELIQFRQIIAVDFDGQTSAFSGGRTLGRYQIAEGQDAVAAGNLLAIPEVPAAMLDAFVDSEDQDLGDRLMVALRAGLEAGGEEGPVRSAGLLIARDAPWPVADLRVDWADDPIGDLGQLWTIWKPQMDDYVARALNPIGAPAFGVPGDPGTV
jgi:uncharacterized Ntn-hydrolase superfamily protein